MPDLSLSGVCDTLVGDGGAGFPYPHFPPAERNPRSLYDAKLARDVRPMTMILLGTGFWRSVGRDDLAQTLRRG
jgi:hypothetical protein